VFEERGRQRCDFGDAETVPFFGKVISIQEFAGVGDSYGLMDREQVQKLMNIADFELRTFGLSIQKTK
jgi:hypothetical protein